MSFTQFNYTKDKVQCQTNGSCIVNMDKDEVLMFSGYVKIQLKSGQIEINGYVMNANANANESRYYKLYSIPYWKHNCLSIKSITKSEIHLYPFDLKSKYRIKQSSKTCDSIFKIIGCHFIMNNNNDQKYQEYQPLLMPLSWKKSSNYLVNNINNKNNINNCIMICGRNQSGKSTFCSYLMNCLLNKYSKIAFLDCDVGQSEFCTEGIISITMIKYPLFGPAHSHFQSFKSFKSCFKPFKSYYFGSNNPMDNPSFYLQCIYKLYSEFITFNNNNNNIPLIINTNGWTKGLGANILKDLIIYFSPNHLIEIYNENQALFAGIEMDYLYQAKQMFIHQNKIHNWCQINQNKNNKNKNNKNKNKNNSLINCWWNQLTTNINDDFTIEQNEKLKPKQKKWSKYLNNLLELKFDNNNNRKWYENINVSKSKKEKTNQELQLFKTFINVHLHLVQSVSGKIEYKNNEEKIKKMIELRRERQKLSSQKRLLAMISYFTQELFMDKTAKYLREMDCFQIGFNEISVMFLQHNMDLNNVRNKGLILHALNGVIVGLCVMNKNKIDLLNPPPFKKQKYNNNNNNEINEWKLNVLDGNDIYENKDINIECVGLGIIRSINVKKQLFYLITPVPVIQLNKVNLFIRGKTSLPSRLIYDTSILTPPLYINSIPMNERILKSTC